MSVQSAKLDLSEQLIVPYIREADYAVRKPWLIHGRKNLDYLLIYVEEGRCISHVEGTDYVLEKGDFCLIQPDQYHTLKGVTDTVTPFVHLDFFFNPDREGSFLSSPGLVDLTPYRQWLQPQLNDFADVHIPVKFHSTDSSQLLETLLRLIRHWQSQDPLKLLEVQHLGMELFLSLLRQFGSMKPSNFTVSPSLDWIPSFLALHLAQPLSVKDMADRAKLSPSRFSAVFRQYYRVSPHRYLLQLRVQHAYKLLTTTEYALADIAEYCGFSNIHHFSRVFKKITAQTPGSLRRS
ncbi:AraC family transcriptional regulator [Paenibacillus psychroresistens]|nr:AraC family transcriptional regulator [Paenibacillus psychroresistens]